MAEFTITKNTNGSYYFQLRSGNGQVLLSSEGYISKDGCINGINAVKANIKDNNKFEKKNTANNKYYFILKAGNGQVIGTSEMFETMASRDNAMVAVQMSGDNVFLNDETFMQLIDLVKNKRKQLGLTQQQLAEKAGVGLRFLRELEQGKNTLRIDKVNQVLKLFGYELGPVLINRNNLIYAES
jgi:uncharacterized protein